MARCEVCFRRCEIAEGKTGFCGVRICEEGIVRPKNYGQITSIALDPIEKKPLARFHPGSMILSVGSYGCNLQCPFCQNHEISWPEPDSRVIAGARKINPQELADLSAYWRREGNIGVAFTYNEPLICWEYVRDAAKLIHEQGQVCVLVTNGTASLEVLEQIRPYIDAMNIDLKGFTDRYYHGLLKGNRQMVMDFIAEAVKHCHVELTTLIVPGENDSEEEMADEARWIASLTDGDGKVNGDEIPLHVTRYFPRYHMMDKTATPVAKVRRLADIAGRSLRYVYVGNC